MATTTIKVSTDTRAMLRVLAAHSGKTMQKFAEDMLWAEMRRLKLPLRTGNGAKPKERK